MSSRLLAGGLWLAGGLLAASAQPLPKPADDVILRAMLDELVRWKPVRVAPTAPAYFIEYALHDGETASASATLGALISARRVRYRMPRVQVRVGGYDSDHANFVGTDFLTGTRWDVEQFPLDDSLPVLRHHLWLATDAAYKAAVESLGRKRALLASMTGAEPLADFARAERLTKVEEWRPAPVNIEVWSARVRKLSALFADYPQIQASSVEFDGSGGLHYLLNIEDTVIRVPEHMLRVRVLASAQAPDGMLLRDHASFCALQAEGMPSELDLERGTRQVAENLAALTRAPLGEAYTGPVLFEGVAGAQLLAEVLGRQFALPRRPLSPPGQPAPFQPSDLEGRLGVRILPEWIDVVDDPTQREWRGRPLMGHYRVDLEGVAPAPLILVEKGTLKNFLLTRQPVRGYAASNGRARLPGPYGAKTATFSNLFVRATTGVSAAELRAQLGALCRERGKPYGLVIRKMDFPTTASFEELRRMLARSGGARPISPPLLAYRLYPDGREELVRGLRFRNLNTRALRDLLAASQETFVFDFLDSGAPLGLTMGAAFLAECSVIAPSLLVDDLELERPQEEQTRPPLAPPPALK